jgi:hypothetical protein
VQADLSSIIAICKVRTTTTAAEMSIRLDSDACMFFDGQDSLIYPLVQCACRFGCSVTASTVYQNGRGMANIRLTAAHISVPHVGHSLSLSRPG